MEGEKNITEQLDCMERLRYMWGGGETRVNEYSRPEKQINCSEKEIIVNNILETNNENIEYGYNFFLTLALYLLGRWGKDRRKDFEIHISVI